VDLKQCSSTTDSRMHKTATE